MEPIQVNTNPDAEAQSLEELLKLLPAKTHYCESYGLQMNINGNCTEWCVRYWTWYPAAEHKQHPKIPTFIGPLKSVLIRLAEYMLSEGHMPREFQPALS
jgi:hypothetical protein